MRAGARPFWFAAAAALAVLGLQAAAAFERGDVAPRDVTAYVVADGGAYVSLAANGASPHKCFVAEGSDGKVSIAMGSALACPSGGTGTGLNEGHAGDGRSAKYAFHSLLNVTNKGTTTVRVWVNATTSSGSSSLVDVALKEAGVAMVDGDYAPTTATPLVLAPGDIAQVGVRASTGTLTAGNPVQGSVAIAARR